MTCGNGQASLPHENRAAAGRVVGPLLAGFGGGSACSLLGNRCGCYRSTVSAGQGLRRGPAQGARGGGPHDHSEYRELGHDYFTRRDNPDTTKRRLIHDLEALGYHVELTATA